MTIKYLTGAYPAGYTLNSKYSGLVIEGTASVGGTGVSADFNTTIWNDGVVEATGGSFGVSLAAGGTVTNGSPGDASALIEGQLGIIVTGGSAKIANYGTLQGLVGMGIRLSVGGTVTNGSSLDTTALIAGNDGVFVDGRSATIANFGAIQAFAGYGVRLAQGGTVTNGSATDTTARIQGEFAVSAKYGSASVTNFGTMEASVFGIVLDKGGTVTNGSASDTTALIAGNSGVVVRSAAATISNLGTITGTDAFGVYLGRGGIITNGSAADTTALITSYGGVEAYAVTTVTNFGTISGLGFAAIKLRSSRSVLVVEAGSAFLGKVLGGGCTLDLASGVGTISNLTDGNVTVSGSMATTTFTDFGTLEIARGVRFTLAGTGAIGHGGTKELIDNGVVTVASELVVMGTVTGSGTLDLSAGATLEFDTAVPAALTVSLQGIGSVLALKDPSAFAAKIGGFNHYGKIDLLGIAATSAVLQAGDKLALTNGGQTVATLQLAGSFAGDTFTTSSDGSGGTFITVSRAGATTPPAPHALIAAAAALGADVGGASAGLTAHSAYGRPVLASPRSQAA